MRTAERIGQFLDLLEGESLLVRLAVEQLQGRDLILVLGYELLEGGDDAPGLLFGALVNSGGNELVFADGVDDLLVGLLDLGELLPEHRIGGKRLWPLPPQAFGGAR